MAARKKPRTAEVAAQPPTPKRNEGAIDVASRGEVAPEEPPDLPFTGWHWVALGAGLVAIGLGAILMALAGSYQSMNPGDPVRALTWKHQWSALAGVLLATVMGTQIRDRKKVVFLAISGLFLGVFVTWWYRLGLNSSFWISLAEGLKDWNEGLTGLGVGFLIKMTEGRTKK